MKYPVGTKLVCNDVNGVVVENFKLQHDICVQWETEDQAYSYDEEWLDENAVIDNTIQHPAYGYCPICGGKGISRERRIDGNDRCENGHTYQSRLSRPTAGKFKFNDEDRKTLEDAFEKALTKSKNPVLEFIDSYLCHGGFFNPEHMSHEKVRDLIMLCREEITRLEEYEWMYKDLQK